MKNLIYVVAGIMFFTISCSERDTNAEPLSNTLKNGHWNITYMTYEGRDITHLYNNDKITFVEEQHTVTGSGMNFTRGNWTTEKDGDRFALTMNWGKVQPYTILNYKWYVISYDDQKVALEYYNPYWSGTDYLTFEKIQ